MPLKEGLDFGRRILGFDFKFLPFSQAFKADALIFGLVEGDFIFQM